MPSKLASKTRGVSSNHKQEKGTVKEGRGKKAGRESKKLKKRPEAKRKAKRHHSSRVEKRRKKRHSSQHSFAVPENDDAGQSKICPICQDYYNEGNFPVVHAPCGHVACVSCSLTWQKKKSSRTCALCRSPVLSIAHCAQLEQLLVPAGGSEASASSSSGPPDNKALRAEAKKGLQELSQCDLNFIPGDYRAHLVRVAAHRAVRKGDLTMLETCLKNFKARASTKLVCEVAGLWKKEPRPVLSLLLAHNARLDGHAENRPLLHAVYCGNAGMVEALLEMKCNVNKTAGGESALHIAIRRGRLACVKLLIQHGINTTLPDPAGREPQFMADMAFRVHEMSCPASPCHRCNERWGIRCALANGGQGLDGAPRGEAEDGGGAGEEQGGQDEEMQDGQEEEQERPETESEDSSSDWEESDSDVSDMDDFASDADEDDDEEEPDDGASDEEEEVSEDTDDDIDDSDDDETESPA